MTTSANLITSLSNLIWTAPKLTANPSTDTAPIIAHLRAENTRLKEEASRFEEKYTDIRRKLDEAERQLAESNLPAHCDIQLLTYKQALELNQLFRELQTEIDQTYKPKLHEYSLSFETIRQEAEKAWKAENPEYQQISSEDLLSSMSTQINAHQKPRDLLATILQLHTKVGILGKIIDIAYEKTAPKFKNYDLFLDRLAPHPFKLAKYENMFKEWQRQVKGELEKKYLFDRLKHLPKNNPETEYLKKIVTLLHNPTQVSRIKNYRQCCDTLFDAINELVQTEWYGAEERNDFHAFIDALIFARMHKTHLSEYLEGVPCLFKDLSGDGIADLENIEDLPLYFQNLVHCVDGAPKNGFLRMTRADEFYDKITGAAGKPYVKKNPACVEHTLVFEDENGKQRKQTKVHYPSMTSHGSLWTMAMRAMATNQDRLTGGQSAAQYNAGNGEHLLPEYEAFIKICERKGMGIFTASQQTFVTNENLVHLKRPGGKPECERGRSNQLIRADEKYKNFHTLIQAMYGPFFEKYNLVSQSHGYADITTFADFKSAVVKVFTDPAVSSELTGCKLPEILRNDSEYKETLGKLFDDVHHLFFNDQEEIKLPESLLSKKLEVEINGKKVKIDQSLDPALNQKLAWQLFLVHFYVFQQLDMPFRLYELCKEYPIEHYVTQCKDALHRAGLLTFALERIIDTILEQEDDPAIMRKRVHTAIGMSTAAKKDGYQEHWTPYVMLAEALRQSMANKDDLKNYRIAGKWAIVEEQYPTSNHPYKQATLLDEADFMDEYIGRLHLDHDQNRYIYTQEPYQPIERKLQWEDLLNVELDLSGQDQKPEGYNQIAYGKDELDFDTFKGTCLRLLPEDRKQHFEPILNHLTSCEKLLRAKLSTLENQKMGIKAAFEKPKSARLNYTFNEIENLLTIAVPFQITTDAQEIARGDAYLKYDLNAQQWSWTYQLGDVAKPEVKTGFDGAVDALKETVYQVSNAATGAIQTVANGSIATLNYLTGSSSSSSDEEVKV